MDMLDLIITVLFCWLFFKALGLTFRLAWGVTKFVVWLLFALALPMMIGCLMLAGGLLLLVPLALVGLAFGLVKACL